MLVIMALWTRFQGITQGALSAVPLIDRKNFNAGDSVTLCTKWDNVSPEFPEDNEVSSWALRTPNSSV